ncbi:hypothetical protein RRG08_030825 [Elysia crispata]|uniref:Uncharacterized protein n=1 Tax=Elysia crispata TaxID=231223 RepID=A0AAE1AAX2_9GAST|nr:hypothetical protein RRG08_030825 [Elysia crispata]
MLQKCYRGRNCVGGNATPTMVNRRTLAVGEVNVEDFSCGAAENFSADVNGRMYLRVDILEYLPFLTNVTSGLHCGRPPREMPVISTLSALIQAFKRTLPDTNLMRCRPD